jgi:uncharacterized repeat protein (TIGR03843 family)
LYDDVHDASRTRSLAAPEDLLEGDLQVLGRITGSSNATFLVQAGGHRAIYKPVTGEQPLWDFPDGTLAAREHATWLVARALGWDVVPPTVLRDGPYGPGSVQAWVEADEEHPLVDLVPGGVHRDGWVRVLSGEDGEGNPVDVVHSSADVLRRLALLDVVVNNSDRKGGHVLALPVGDEIHGYGIDHGLTFHHEPKLRTVLWGWVGEPLLPDETAALSSLRGQLRQGSSAVPGAPLATALDELLSAEEYAATVSRLDALLEQAAFPPPDEGWPSVPWPAF